MLKLITPPPVGDTYADYASIPDGLKDGAKPTRVSVGDREVPVATWADVLVAVSKTLIRAGKALPFPPVPPQSKGAVDLGDGTWVDQQVGTADTVGRVQACAAVLDAAILVACEVKGSAKPGFTVRLDPKKPRESVAVDARRHEVAPKDPVALTRASGAPLPATAKVGGKSSITRGPADAANVGHDHTNPDAWSEPDPVWAMDPATVTEAHLLGVRARGRVSGPALLRDALLLGRVRRANALAKRNTAWMLAATSYKERRLQDFRQVADALDGLTPGVTVPGVTRPTDGSAAEPPARWLAEGIDAALEEVRKLKSAADAKVKAENAQAVADAENNQPPEKRAAMALARARAQFGKGAWDDDIGEASGVLNIHPVLVDEVVDAVVDMLVRSVAVLPTKRRVAALERARVAIAEAEAKVAPEEAEPACLPEPPDGGPIEDLIITEAELEPQPERQDGGDGKDIVNVPEPALRPQPADVGPVLAPIEVAEPEPTPAVGDAMDELLNGVKR